MVIAWKERIVHTYHYGQKQKVTIGHSERNDIVFPILGSYIKEHTLLKISQDLQVFLTSEMEAQLIDKDGETEDISQFDSISPGSNSVILQQGQMLRIDFSEGLMSIYIRFIPESSKPLANPFFDMSSKGLLAFLVAFFLPAIFGLYMFLYDPPPKEEEEDKKLRVAKVYFKPPIKKIDIKQAPKVKRSIKKPRVVKKKRRGLGKRSKIAPNKKNKKKIQSKKKTQSKKKRISKSRPSGRTKKSPPKKDISKLGLLGVFSNRGGQSGVNRGSKSSDLKGLAEQTSGPRSNSLGRDRDSGLELKDIGASGKGKSSVGIAGIKSQAPKGLGNFNLGQGGLGRKTDVILNLSGDDEEFIGSVDKEALRRQLRKNRKSFEYCYELGLKDRPDLTGKIILQWSIIDSSGIVDNVRVVGGSLRSNRRVSNCLIRRMGVLTFPKIVPVGHKARIRYGFIFTRKK